MLLLSACAVWPPGKDPRGRALIKKANVVLAAATRYAQVHGANPKALQDVAPEFIAELPSVPELRYNAGKGWMTFTYSPSLAMGRCTCGATIGDATFSCGVCYL